MDLFIRFLELIICLSLVAAVSPTSCRVSEWGTWGPWRTPHYTQSYQSFPTYSRSMMGGKARKGMMALKAKNFDDRAQCLAEGTCPDLVRRRSQGPAACIDGYIREVIPCAHIDQLSFVDFVDLGVDFTFDPVPQGNDIWGWYDNETGDEYAIMGVTSGTSFVRITDPSHPVTVGWLPTQTTPSPWRDMKVVGDYVYVVAEALGHGIQVYDLTRLRGRQTIQTDSPDIHYDRVGHCHNIISNVDTNFVYAVGCTESSYTDHCRGGLHVVDVTDPLNPVFAGCFDGDGYVHDAQCVNYVGPDPEHQGKEICFCYNEDTFTIVDVTDKTNMQMLSRTGYQKASYTHQGWMTEDMTLVLMDDELDELRGQSETTTTMMWNIEDLDAPVLMNTYVSAHTSIDHNQYIIGDITYQANYASGLRILKINKERFMLQEIAHFDVYPSQNVIAFYGLWSVYPFFPSRNLILSSIDFGLYVVRPDYDVIDSSQPWFYNSERHRYRQILEADEATSCPKLDQTQKLHKSF